MEPTIYNLKQIDSLPITSTKLASATRTDLVLSKVYNFVTHGWPQKVEESLNCYYSRRYELTVEGGCVLWGCRTIIPEKLHKQLLSELHFSHLGIHKMEAMARSFMLWPGLDSSIEEQVKSCMDCQSVKKAPQKAPLYPWKWPSRVFQRLHIDFAGPFQGSLVMVDAYSKWPHVVTMQSTTSTKTIEVLRNLFSMYGVPEHIVSDNGSQFASEEFAIFMKMNGIHHTRTAPYHPATNGLAERFVQSLKQGLKASKSSEHSLSKRLDNFLMMYRSTVHSNTGVTPSSLFLKRELWTRFDLLRPNREIEVDWKQSQQKQTHDRHSAMRTFNVGDLVMVRNFRVGPNWVPATVIARLGPLSYLLETAEKQLWRRHVDHVKTRTNSHKYVSPQAQSNTTEGAWDHATGTTSSTVRNFEQGTETDVGSDNQQSTDNVSGTDSNTSSEPATTVNPTSDQTRRYPGREHHTPEYYRPHF